jgi:hypothetical protein
VDGTTVIDVTDEGIDPDTDLPAGLFVTEFDVVGFAIGSSGVVFDYRLDNIRLDTASMIALPGDHNGDGNVDAADYVVWRKTDGAPQGYTDWRTNFGATLNVGSAAVPEPATAAIVLFAALLFFYHRGHRGHGGRQLDNSPSVH